MMIMRRVRMREQAQLAIRLFDLGVGARRAAVLQPQNLVKGGWAAPLDAQHGRLLLDRVRPPRAAVVVAAPVVGAVARPVAAVGVGA